MWKMKNDAIYEKSKSIYFLTERQESREWEWKKRGLKSCNMLMSHSFLNMLFYTPSMMRFSIKNPPSQSPPLASSHSSIICYMSESHSHSFLYLSCISLLNVLKIYIFIQGRIIIPWQHSSSHFYLWFWFWFLESQMCQRLEKF
jgi:hypothetical protein